MRFCTQSQPEETISFPSLDKQIHHTERSHTKAQPSRKMFYTWKLLRSREILAWTRTVATRNTSTKMLDRLTTFRLILRGLVKKNIICMHVLGITRWRRLPEFRSSCIPAAIHCKIVGSDGLKTVKCHRKLHQGDKPSSMNRVTFELLRFSQNVTSTKRRSSWRDFSFSWATKLFCDLTKQKPRNQWTAVCSPPRLVWANCRLLLVAVCMSIFVFQTWMLKGRKCTLIYIFHQPPPGDCRGGGVSLQRRRSIEENEPN